MSNLVSLRRGPRRGSVVRLSALCVLAALAWWAAVLPATAQSAIERIRGAGELRVAVFFEDVPPFFYVDGDGELAGVDPSIARDVADKLGVKVAFNRAATTFDGLIDEVIEGRADVAISLISDTLDRAMRVSFTRSYVGVRQFLLINRLELGKLLAADANSGKSIPRLLDSATSRIGVIGGTSYVGFVDEDFPRARHVEFDTWADMLDAVKRGELVALMYDEIEVGNWRLDDPAGALQLRPYYLEGHTDSIAIAVRQDDTDLRDWLNLYLTKAEANGFLASVLDRHLYSTDRMLSDD